MLHAQAQVECRIQTILERHRVKQPGKYKTTRQTDGTSCSSFPWETHITCENRVHGTVPEKDVSSPTFNSGISRANGMKHALKAFEEKFFSCFSQCQMILLFTPSLWVML